MLLQVLDAQASRADLPTLLGTGRAAEVGQHRCTSSVTASPLIPLPDRTRIDTGLQTVGKDWKVGKTFTKIALPCVGPGIRQPWFKPWLRPGFSGDLWSSLGGLTKPHLLPCRRGIITWLTLRPLESSPVCPARSASPVHNLGTVSGGKR